MHVYHTGGFIIFTYFSTTSSRNSIILYSYGNVNNYYCLYYLSSS